MRDCADVLKQARTCANRKYCDIGGNCEYYDLDVCCQGNEKDILQDAADAIEELQAKVPRWVSVEERLPETYRVVLVIKDHPVDYLHGYEFACRFNNGEWSGNSRKVLYWMYLPEPPAGGELNGD